MAFFKKKQTLPTRRAHNFAQRPLEGERVASSSTFQRNRTLTGSLSSSVRGASERTAELRSDRMQAHDLRHHRKRLVLILMVVVLAVAALGYGIYQSIATPRVIIDTISSVDVSVYEQKIQSYLDMHPFERSRLTLNTTNLATYLQENNCPEVESVSSKLEYVSFGVSSITVKTRTPVVSWTAGSKTFYVDANGNAFERNYFAKPAVSVIDQTGIQAQDNQILISNRFLGFIGKAVGRFAERDYTVTRIVLPANTTRQILVTLEGVGYPVKITVDRPAAGQVEDAIHAIQYLVREAIQPAEYLDVRVSGRGYYK